MSGKQTNNQREFDLFSPDFKRDPFPTFEAMRSESPVYAHVTPDGSTIWYITRYTDVLAVLRDDEYFCKNPRSTGLSRITGNASRKTAMHHLLAVVHQDPARWDAAVEELLRFDGPVETSTSRWARRDIMFDGHLIKRGDLVRVVLSSANRDTDYFDHANELHIDREEKKHLAFGHGIHYCLGAPLARLEGKIALQTLFSRLDNIRLSSTAEHLQWRTGVLFRGLHSLEICWDKQTDDSVKQ